MRRRPLIELEEGKEEQKGERGTQSVCAMAVACI